MLVLTRRKNEVLMIGDIAVMIVEIRGDKIRIGVDAPKEVPVHRKEVYDIIHGIGNNNATETGGTES